LEEELMANLSPILRGDTLIHIKIYRNSFEIYKLDLRFKDFSEMKIFENTLISDLLINTSEDNNDIIYQILQKNITIGSCFLKGYRIDIMNRTIDGNGDYLKCYDLMKTVTKDQKYFRNFVYHNRNIHLTPEMREINELLKMKNPTLESLRTTANVICRSNYTDIFKTGIQKIDSICIKLVNVILLSEQINDNKHLHIASDSAKQLTNALLFLIFIISYIYKDELTEWTEYAFLREEVVCDGKINYRLLLTVLPTSIMKKYLLRNHLEELNYSSKDIFYNYDKYINVFVNLAKTNKAILNEANQILQDKNMLYSAIYVSKVQIMMASILSVLTYRFVKELNLFYHWYSIALVLFSFLYMFIIILESLKLIESTDQLKVYSLKNTTDCNFD
jgi:hypothetical protein